MFYEGPISCAQATTLQGRAQLVLAANLLERLLVDYERHSRAALRQSAMRMLRRAGARFRAAAL